MYNDGSSPSLVNVSFLGNTALDGGGMFNTMSSPTLTNCILWDNAASDNGPQIYNADSSTTEVNYSLVEDECPNLSTCDKTIIFSPPPKFENAANDLRLQEGSPAIDAGDKAAVPADVTTDLDDKPRFCGNSVDTGAYE